MFNGTEAILLSPTKATPVVAPSGLLPEEATEDAMIEQIGIPSNLAFAG